MNKTDAIAFILRQCNGTLLPDDARALTAWLAQDPEHRAIRERITSLQHADWKSLPLSPPPDFFAQQREKLLQRAAEIETYRDSMQWRIRIAAVITLAVLASLFIYFTTQHALRTTPTLSFSNTELHQVAQTLEQVYDIPVDVDESVRTLRFTGQFIRADASDVLAALNANLPITLEQHHHSYIVKARN